jgi:hypothetical protein
MSRSDLTKLNWRQIIMPGGKGQGIALFLTLINGLLFSFVVLPYLIKYFGLRPIDTVGEHYLMVPGLLGGRGLIWGNDGGIPFMMAKEPGYTFLFAMVYKVFGTLDIRFVQVVQIIFNVSICWLVWTIGYISTNKRSVATVAAVCYAFHPLALLYSARIWNDIPSSFWVILSTWLFLLTLRDRSIMKGALAGCSLAIATLFRTPSFGLYFVFIACLFLVKDVLSRGDRNVLSMHIVQKAKIAAAIAIMFFLFLSPWTIRNFMLSGRPVMLVTIQSWATWIDGGELVKLWSLNDNIWPKDTEVKKFSLLRNIYVEEKQVDHERSGAVVELRIHDRLRSVVMNEIQKDPSGYIKRIAKSFFLFWYLGSHKVFSYYMLLINIILIPLALTGAIIALRRRNVYLVLLLSIMMYFWIVYAMVISYCRYSISAIPYAIILAVFAGSYIYNEINKSKRNTVYLKE